VVAGSNPAGVAIYFNTFCFESVPVIIPHGIRSHDRAGAVQKWNGGAGRATALIKLRGIGGSHILLEGNF
jgi:hypothetical protein